VKTEQADIDVETNDELTRARRALLNIGGLVFSTGRMDEWTKETVSLLNPINL